MLLLFFVAVDCNIYSLSYFLQLRRKFQVVESFKFPPKKTLGNKVSTSIRVDRALSRVSGKRQTADSFENFSK